MLAEECGGLAGASGGPVQAQDEPALKVCTSGLADAST